METVGQRHPFGMAFRFTCDLAQITVSDGVLVSKALQAFVSYLSRSYAQSVITPVREAERLGCFSDQRDNRKDTAYLERYDDNQI